MALQLSSLDCGRSILDEYNKHNLFDEGELVMYLMMLTLAVTEWQS